MSIYEKKKLFAILHVVKKWRHYLEGGSFIIKTDQQNIKHFLEQKVTTMLQQKGIVKLISLNYTIQFKKRPKKQGD